MISYVVAGTRGVWDLFLQIYKINKTPSEHETNAMEMLIPTAIGHVVSVEDWQVAGKNIDMSRILLTYEKCTLQFVAVSI